MDQEFKFVLPPIHGPCHSKTKQVISTTPTTKIKQKTRKVKNFQTVREEPSSSCKQFLSLGLYANYSFVHFSKSLAQYDGVGCPFGEYFLPGSQLPLVGKDG